MTVFTLEDALSVWTNSGKHLLLVWLFVFSIKTGTRRIIRLDELSSVIRLERRTTENRLSRGIMVLVPVFILETNNQTKNKCLPKFVQTDNASSSIKTANLVPRVFVPYCAGLTKRASRPLVKENKDWVRGNLVPRVFRLFGQRGNAGKTLGTSKKFNFFDWLFRNGCHCFTAEILR